MEPADKTTETRCEHCGKPLFGRTDKRFCNDGCRNAFNRFKSQFERQLWEHENVPEVLKIIRNNYKILRSYHPGTDYYENVLTEDLLEKGFNFRFFTSVAQEKDNLWRFCFDLGWLEVNERCSLIERPEQMETEDRIRMI